MIKKGGKILRRDFFKASGAGLAALASTPLWAGAGNDIAAPDRTTPAAPVTLKSSQLELVLDGRDGLPYEFRLLALGTEMRGEDRGAKIEVTLCRLDPWTFTTIPLAASWSSVTGSQADFRFEAEFDGKPAATFTVRYVVEDSTVHISLESVIELAGYELIEVALPRLVTVREGDGHAWLAHGDGGGSVVSLDKAKSGRLKPNTFWGKVLASLPMVMLGTDRAICVQEVTAYMNGTELAVEGDAGHRRASIGIIQTHRVNGSLCYDMNTGPNTPRNCGNSGTPNLMVGQKSTCRLDFIGDIDGDGKLDWLDGAKFARSHMPAIPTHYYDDKLIYAIHCDQPLWPKPGATFEQAGKLIRDVATLTDQMPQVAHLWGWQYRGKDTGYPAVAEVNPRIGGYDGMMKLMEEARKVNCACTLSDNYDDAYKSSPAWDPAIIERRPDGELWESRNWTGENSYIIGMAKYMQGPGIERVNYTCERYKLRETTHVDVLTYFSIRNDWDRERPASGVKNLVEGRYRVLAEFAGHGVDVSSEALRYAFIGKVSCFWYAQQPLSDPFSEESLTDAFGGESIPLLTTIYRKSAVWGQSGKTKGPLDQMLKMLFYNGCVHSWIRSDADMKEMTDWVYLYVVPWIKVHGLNIETFKREGDRTLIGLEGEASIDLDWRKQTYSVSVGGAEIARDSSTFCPVDDGRIAFYSLNSRELSAPLPAAWDAGKIAAIALSLEKASELPATVDGGKINVSVPARQPVMVYRDGKKARKRLLQAG